MNKPKLDEDLPLWNPQQAHLWAVRSLLCYHTRAIRSGIASGFFSASRDSIAATLDIDGRQCEAFEDMKSGASSKLVRLLRQREVQCLRTYKPVTNILEENLKKMGDSLGLSGVERMLLMFFVVQREDNVLHDISGFFGNLSVSQLYRALADVVELDRREVRSALSPSGVLFRSGLLDVRSISSPNFCIEDLAPALLLWPLELQSLFDSYFRHVTRASLKLDDFAFLGTRLDTLRELLGGAISRRTRGVNILVYGVPGTGKTELCRALNRALGRDLYEIAHENTDGTPLSGNERFRGYALCQRVLRASGNSLVVFDEVDDAFRSEYGGSFGQSPWQQKAWINRILEDNPVPAIWISNRLDPLDSAYLRRFTYSLELAPPPAARKRQLLESALRGIDDADKIAARAARCRNLTPADIERTGRAVGLMTCGKEQRATPGQVIEVLASRPDGPDRAELKSNAPDVAIGFDPTLINADTHSEAVVQGIKRTGSGRLCFYGPPGTGKTAFAHHIAEVLGKDLNTVSASDWLHPFVGMTETAIRQAFDEAEANDTVLFIDEADSFLRSREGADHVWELTQVNELLKRLETANGVVILATNFMDSTDHAVLRRLDIKIRFDYLRPEQTVRMFRAALQYLTGKPARLSQDINHQLTRLTEVAGGDFVTCARRLTIMDEKMTANALLSALKDEVAMKPGNKPSVGFVQA